MAYLIAATAYCPEVDKFILSIDGKLPFESSEDMSRFKELTTGGIVIMGRKTFESIGKALPDRLNIVITTQSKYSFPPGVAMSASLEEAVEFADSQKDRKTWIIGGGEIYKQALDLDLPTRLYISLMKQYYTPNEEIGEVVTFPKVDTDKYKAVYYETFEDHYFKIISKHSLRVV